MKDAGSTPITVTGTLLSVIVRPTAEGVNVQPRLLPGVDRMTANVRIREMTLQLEVITDDSIRLEPAYVLPYGTGEVAAQIKARRATSGADGA